jgi:hypothetical protein
MTFEPGDLVERVSWGTIGPDGGQKSFRSCGAKGIILQSSEKRHAVKVFWLDSQATSFEWAHDLGKISTAPPENQPQS